MKKWIPYQLNESMAATERAEIARRAADLVSNDPHAAGVVDTFAVTVVGSGLKPHPRLDADLLGLTKERVKEIQDQQKRIFKLWNPFADASQKMTFGMLQFLAQRMVVEYGEFLFLLPMLKDSARPYSLAVQPINPMRLRTPIDLQGEPNIKDGIEVGKYGEPVAYWIKKSENDYQRLVDVSTNFVRISAKRGHRWRVLHGFAVKEPEQVRGYSFFTPGMKFFKDLSDFLDAELVANVVTAAFALFIETQATDPLMPAGAMATITETGYKSDGSAYDQRYEEIDPGTVMYGNMGEKPHTINANRPGKTFEPFVKLVLGAVANSVGIPYPVLFKDFQGMSYASYRSAMLEAWRVFRTSRKWLGDQLCQPVYTMLMEEAYLRKDLKVRMFYKNMHKLTQAEWIGPPKGQIEPVKEVQADVMSIKNKLKSREEVMLENDRDMASTFEQISDEKDLMEKLGIEEEVEEEIDQGGLPGTGL
jgi:lambda family phage portal protein